jgi:hypothetical protein
MGPPRPTRIDFDATGLAPDATSVNLLARLQLVTRRAGADLSVRRASAELVSLLVFAGLAEVLLDEPGREIEEREERLGVEEERELADQAALEFDDL